jgi:hypothetical protein
MRACHALQGVHEFASVDLYAKGLLLGDIFYCNVCRRSILNALGGLQCVGTRGCRSDRAMIDGMLFTLEALECLTVSRLRGRVSVRVHVAH